MAETFTIRGAEDLGEVLRFPPRFRRVRLAPGLVGPGASERIQAALDRDYNACGCGLGGAAMALAVTFTGPPLAALWWLRVLDVWVVAAGLLAVALVAMLAGKLAGLAFSYLALRRSVAELRRQLTPAARAQPSLRIVSFFGS